MSKEVQGSARHCKAVEGAGSHFQSVCGAVVQLVRTLPRRWLESCTVTASLACNKATISSLPSRATNPNPKLGKPPVLPLNELRPLVVSDCTQDLIFPYSGLLIVLPAVVKARLVVLPLNEKFSFREISVGSLSFIPLPHWHNQE